jgi:hypothetical protein
MGSCGGGRVRGRGDCAVFIFASERGVAAFTSRHGPQHTYGALAHDHAYGNIAIVRDQVIS